jgi:hypothetical protein
MRDIKSDWKRWSRAERIFAIVIVALYAIAAPSLLAWAATGSAANS